MLHPLGKMTYWITFKWQLVVQKGGRGGDFTWCNGFPLGHNQLWEHWDFMMGAFCECSHSKCASMVSSHLAYIMMWCNMLHECHCAIGQTTSWYKKGTITVYNILMYYGVNRKYLKAMLIEH
jgi:hypothetical protein